MAEVDTVQIPTITQPTAGETVATMSKAIKSLGLPGDAKNSATDTTSITMMQVMKQVSAELQLLRTALGSTALDLGISTGGTRTLRIAVDTASQNANGTTTDANSTPVAWSTEGKAQVGSLTETAPASDTASSGMNGRLQRIAQRITSMIALLPTALGSAASAASLPVVIASDQGAVAAKLTPTTSGGLTISSTLVASGTNATSVKASAGQLYKIEVTNNSANIGYLKIYNTAGTPTAGSGTPVIRLMCPGNASGSGVLSTFDNGVAFATGIGFTFTGGIADADTTSVAASAFIVNLYYK